MAIAFGTPITSSFGDTIVNSCTLSGLVLSSGDYAILQMTVIKKSSVTMPPTAPLWNGQSFTLIANVEDNVGSPESYCLVYGVKASAGATADVTWGFDQYVPLSASVIKVAGQDQTTAIGAVVTQSQWTSSGWSAPSRNVTDSVSNDVIYSVLGSPGWDDGYSNMSAVVWTPAAGQSALLFDQKNSAGGSSAYARIMASTKAGASGTVNVAYTKDTGYPAYQHIAFAIKAAVTQSVDTITSSITHGGSGTFTYTGLGTITAMTVDGVAVASVSGTGGSGTFTMPSRVDGATIAGHGSKAVVITGNLASASTTMIVAEAAAQQYVAITSLGTGVGALATYYAILTTDEITSDTPATLGVTTSNIGADTLIHTDYTGAQTLWWWKASTKVVTQITMINGVVTLGGLTRAGITGAITTSGITS